MNMSSEFYPFHYNYVTTYRLGRGSVCFTYLLISFPMRQKMAARLARLLRALRIKFIKHVTSPWCVNREYSPAIKEERLLLSPYFSPFPLYFYPTHYMKKIAWSTYFGVPFFFSSSFILLCIHYKPSGGLFEAMKKFICILK